MLHFLINTCADDTSIIQPLLSMQICFEVVYMCWPWKLTEPVVPMTQSAGEPVWRLESEPGDLCIVHGSGRLA